MKNEINPSTVSSVWSLVQPIIEGLGLKIWDIRFLKEGANWYLRIFIEKENGVTIDDCEKVSRAIDAPLDKLDPIQNSYCLEVSSPGIERELTRPEHFQKYLGHEVIVRFIRPIDGNKKEVIGVLESFESNVITIRLANDEKISKQKKEIVFVKLNDFNIKQEELEENE